MTATQKRTNKKRIDYNYQVGETVKMRVYDPDRLQERFKGAYGISHQVFTNHGIVSLEVKPNVITTVDIRKIEQYHRQL